jgi:hypothetical protein
VSPEGAIEPLNMKCFGDGDAELSEEGTTMILYEAFVVDKLST